MCFVDKQNHMKLHIWLDLPVSIEWQNFSSPAKQKNEKL